MISINGMMKKNNLKSFESDKLANKYDLFLSDDHGFSLLHWACWEGRLSICEMLLNRGAKVNSVNKCKL